MITRRVAWLVATGRADAGGVLAITFTNKAARELRERVEALLPARGMWVGTFHATCARLLRREIDALPPFTRDFSIYDTHDRNVLLKELVKELGYDTTRFRPGMVGAWISARKNSAPEAGDERGGFEVELLLRVAERYEQALKDRNALDFDDLLLRTLEVFERVPGALERYAARFRHVLVDEYQDTNHVQYLLTRALSGFHGNLTVCGDPDQSIYAWRGADISNILDFERDFPGAAVVKLERNYRSTKTILAAAQGVIRHNRGRVEKSLWSDGAEGEPLVLVEAGDENEEADEIAARIAGLVAAGASHADVAVFYRVNFQQRALERGLRLAGIPYRIAGGVEFYQRREVRDLTAYLQLLANPADDVACARVLNVPARGIGDKSVERLAAFAADRRVPLARAIQSPEA
ncbi:MAG TPA: UvrD-helicase domain-containing protein, partial [Planctomycetota bacterium]|nr:UvrD-helicase domain-containing protein [Planctomycetota bacterium]